MSSSRPYTAIATQISLSTINDALKDVTQAQHDTAADVATTDSIHHNQLYDTRPYTAVADQIACNTIHDVINESKQTNNHMMHNTTDQFDAANTDSNLHASRPYTAIASELIDNTINELVTQSHPNILNISHTSYTEHESDHIENNGVDISNTLQSALNQSDESSNDTSTESCNDLHITQSNQQLHPHFTNYPNDGIIEHNPATDSLYNHTMELTALPQLTNHTTDPIVDSNIINVDHSMPQHIVDIENTDTTNQQRISAKSSQPTSIKKQIEQCKLQLKQLTRINTTHLHTIRTLTQQRIDLDQQLKYVHNITNGLVKAPVQYNMQNTAEYNQSLKSYSIQQSDYIKQLQSQIFILKRKSGNIDHVPAHR